MVKFHYVVKMKLIRRKKKNGDIEFLETEKKFENESPIAAREAAFNYYQNYIDVLLESKQKKYQSDKQAREELKSFIETGTKKKIEIGGEIIEWNATYGNGIGVFLVPNESIGEYPYEREKGKELYIHGIGTKDVLGSDPSSLSYGLETEYKFYKLYNHKTSDKAKEVLFCDPEDWGEGYRDEQPLTLKILETPFDWTGLDKPYWWGDPEDDDLEETEEVSITLEDIIQGGESNMVEFKPTLLYNFNTGKAGIGIKKIIAKTICSFLNANGGFLFIGINDNGKPQGLSYDYSLSDKKNKRDFFRLEFDQMIEYFLSFSVKSNISGGFYEHDGEDIYVVKVFPSKRGPIFLKGQYGKEFYVRGMASSRPLTDIEDLANYCIEKWGKEDE